MNSKVSTKAVFITIFLDLLGFSLVFPLVPAMMDYYLTHDSGSLGLKLIFDIMNLVTPEEGFMNLSNQTVFFGGILGAIYSLLQFIFSPFWGTLSDRIGRRPILLITVMGLIVSYGVWFFASTFSVLLLSRVMAGMMSGNISTATAVISDITPRDNRVKGMAVVGIAFALGFVIGPSIGALCSLVDLTQVKSLESWGLTPFSFAALVSIILSTINLLYIFFSLPETREKSGQDNRSFIQTLNPFKAVENQYIKITNWAYFVFLTAFAGMEFTLTFLAVERFMYTPKQNGLIFIFVGLVVALIQGGFVRRKAHQIGERKLAFVGLVILVPAMVMLSMAQTEFSLYFSLFLMAAGSSMVIPTLTTLVSLYSSKEKQGEMLGVFRSFGALSRVVGPLGGSYLYWRFGSSTPYIVAAVMLFIPIVLLGMLKRAKGEVRV